MRGKIIGSIILVVVGCLLTLSSIRWHSTDTPPQSNQKRSSQSGFRFIAMGDMLAHDSVVVQAKRGDSYDFTPYFSQVRTLYRPSTDVVFCNPETLSTGPQYPTSGYPAFNAPIEFIQALRDPTNGLGCNVINLASNHVNDKGQEQLAATITNWESLKPLAFSGANRTVEEQNKVAYFTKHGIKVAFVAFADYSNNTALSPFGLNNYHDTTLVTRLLTQARAQADLVIVSMHWGTENSSIVNSDQVAVTQLLASLGTDIIIGTGPHVLQQVAQIPKQGGGQTTVWYSIGNFLSSQLQADELTGGIAAMDIVKSNRGVVIQNLQFYPTFMSYQWTDTDKRAENLLARHTLQLQPLVRADSAIKSMFPELSTAERMQYVQQTLGPLVQVK